MFSVHRKQDVNTRRKQTKCKQRYFFIYFDFQKHEAHSQRLSTRPPVRRTPHHHGSSCFCCTTCRLCDTMRAGSTDKHTWQLTDSRAAAVTLNKDCSELEATTDSIPKQNWGKKYSERTIISLLREILTILLYLMSKFRNAAQAYIHLILLQDYHKILLKSIKSAWLHVWLHHSDILNSLLNSCHVKSLWHDLLLSKNNSSLYWPVHHHCPDYSALNQQSSLFVCLLFSPTDAPQSSKRMCKPKEPGRLMFN